MLIALTGLHGVGKSYFADNILVKRGFKIYNKKELLPYICKNETGRDDWNNGIESLLKKMLKKLQNYFYHI